MWLVRVQPPPRCEGRQWNQLSVLWLPQPCLSVSPCFSEENGHGGEGMDLWLGGTGSHIIYSPSKQREIINNWN